MGTTRHDGITQEPGADARALARAVRDNFAALTAEGFTEAQALALLGQMLAASVREGRSS